MKFTQLQDVREVRPAIRTLDCEGSLFQSNSSRPDRPSPPMLLQTYSVTEAQTIDRLISGQSVQVWLPRPTEAALMMGGPLRPAAAETELTN